MIIKKAVFAAATLAVSLSVNAVSWVHQSGANEYTGKPFDKVTATTTAEDLMLTFQCEPDFVLLVITAKYITSYSPFLYWRTADAPGGKISGMSDPGDTYLSRGAFKFSDMPEVAKLKAAIMRGERIKLELYNSAGTAFNFWLDAAPGAAALDGLSTCP